MNNILMVLRMNQSQSAITTIILKNKQTRKHVARSLSMYGLPSTCDTSILDFGRSQVETGAVKEIQNTRRVC